MYTRYLRHDLSRQRLDMVPKSEPIRRLKRRWEDRLLVPYCCLRYSSSQVRLGSSSQEAGSQTGAESRRQQQKYHNWRCYHSSVPIMSERPIHTTAPRFVSPANSALLKFDDVGDDEDDNNHNNNASGGFDQFFSNNSAWQSKTSTSNEDRWFGVTSSSSPCPSLDDQLGETNIWDVGSLFEEDSEEDDDEHDASIDSENPDIATPTERKEYPPTQKYSGVDVMKNFDKCGPPVNASLEQQQLWLECESQLESTLKHQKVIASARNRKDYASLPFIQRLLVEWHDPLKAAVEEQQKDILTRRRKVPYGPYLCALPATKVAVVLAYEAVTFSLLNHGRNTQRGCLLTSIVERIGNALEEEVAVQRVLRKRADESSRGRSTKNRKNKSDTISPDDPPENSRDDFDDMIETWTYGTSHLRRFLEEINKNGKVKGPRSQSIWAVKRARHILERDFDWPRIEKVQLGAALLKALIDEATVKINGVEHKVFEYDLRNIKGKIYGYVTLCEEFYKMVAEDSYQQLHPFSTRLKPMIVPSRKWVAPDDGGYCWLKVELMRYHRCDVQREALQMADLSTVFDGLNVLGRVPWKINKEILKVAKRCWDENIELGDIPTRTNYEIPEQPLWPSSLANYKELEKESPQYAQANAERLKYFESHHKYNRLIQKNMDLNSLRCSAVLKLDQAEKFKDFDEIFFPFNMDFRGRAYPVPPHLSTVGSDLCRGLLKFAVAKPLGPRGLYWLKVHLANLAGKDKMSFDDRAAFVDKALDNVRASVKDPFECRWWMELEDPFQGLAACHEIVKAMDSGDPESYKCSLAVHMDGSCNGLQHYAALGRDVVGGRAVNLCNVDSPQDVYVGVMHEVIRRVGLEAARTLDFADHDFYKLSAAQKTEMKRNKAAKLVDGLIDRGVVKRTVMTSVYGVTFIGARKQIQEKIEEKLEQRGHDIDELENEIYGACNYLAQVTMEVMGELFTGAKETMAWLTSCARLIAQQGHPVAWVSPIGVPVVQPYRESRRYQIQTLMQKVTLASSLDNLPIHKRRQVTAFPPNFIHSLDSSHMLLTGLEMDRRGLTFSAVHDSFWTHPCDVDEMNEVLRDCFVQLYEQPLLERLKKSWEMRYPTIEFPDLPQRGSLDLNEVKLARYFFQ